MFLDKRDKQMVQYLPNTQKPFTLNLGSSFVSLILLYIVIVGYAIPSDSFSYYSRAVFLILPIYFGLSIYEGITAFSLREGLILSALLLLFSVYLLFGAQTYGTPFLAEIILIHILSKTRVNVPRRFLAICYIILLLSIIYYCHAPGLSPRYGLGTRGINMSGIYMLLFFHFCYKNNFLLGKLVSLIFIMLLLSRTYFLAIVVFYFFRTFQAQINLVLEKLRIKRVEIFVFLALSLSLILSSIFVTYVEKPEKVSSEHGRLLHYSDRSIYRRSIANIFIWDLMSTDTHAFMFGLGKSTGEVYRNNSVHVPHNSYLQIIGGYGVLFSLVYFYVISKIMNRHFSRDNLPYIFSYLALLCSIHSGISGLPLIFFVIVLKMRQREKTDRLGIQRMLSRIVK